MKTRVKKYKFADKVDEIKALNIRMPYDMWKFLKQSSLDEEKSINCIIIQQLAKYQNRKQGV